MWRDRRLMKLGRPELEQSLLQLSSLQSLLREERRERESVLLADTLLSAYIAVFSELLAH